MVKRLSPSEAIAYEYELAAAAKSKSSSSNSNISSNQSGTPSGSGGGGVVGYYYELGTNKVYTKSETDPNAKFEEFKGSINYADTNKSSVSQGYYYELGRSGEPTGNVYTKPETAPATEFKKVNQPISFNKPQELQPATSSISAVSNPQTLPQRYERPFTSAAKESISNLGNVGIIGQQGLGAYFKQAFYTPFSYVGKPRIYDVNTYPTPKWRGTMIDEGYTPADYSGQIKINQFDVLQGQERALYESAGLKYTGEPARVFPQRYSEKIAGDLRSKYQAEADAGGDIEDINKRFQADVQAKYSAGIGGYANRIQSIESKSAKLSEPRYYPAIRTAGRVVETGAIVGASAFGGSGVTFATSAYLGGRTFASGVEYGANFNKLSTGQKILGAAAIGVSGSAAVYTFNLGRSRLFSEWRQAIYTDLSSAQARTLGVETIKGADFTRYSLTSARRSGANVATTKLNTDVYRTGADRVGFYSVGKTTTKIFEPETMKFISRTESFSASGFVPNIASSSIQFTTKAGSVADLSKKAYYGEGQGIISRPGEVRSFDFIAVSKNQKDYYATLGATPQKQTLKFGVDRTLNIETGRVSYSLGQFQGYSVGGKIENVGRIYKIKETYPSVSSGTTTLTRLKTDFGFGTPITQQVASTSQKLALTETAKSFKSPALSPTSASQIARQIAPRNQAYSVIARPQSQVLISPINKARSSLSLNRGAALLPTSEVLLPPSSKSRGGLALVSLPNISTSLGIGTRNAQALGVSQAVTPRFRQETQQRSITKLAAANISVGALSLGGAYVPKVTPTAIPFGFKFGGGASFLGTRFLGGGKSPTKYVPSFSALVFNIRGTSGSGASLKTGLTLRPISSGFKFQFGFQSKLLRRFLRQ